jgi:hypothetical protein
MTPWCICFRWQHQRVPPESTLLPDFHFLMEHIHDVLHDSVSSCHLVESNLLLLSYGYASVPHKVYHIDYNVLCINCPCLLHLQIVWIVINLVFGLGAPAQKNNFFELRFMSDPVTCDHYVQYRNIFALVSCTCIKITVFYLHRFSK